MFLTRDLDELTGAGAGGSEWVLLGKQMLALSKHIPSDAIDDDFKDRVTKIISADEQRTPILINTPDHDRPHSKPQTTSTNERRPFVDRCFMIRARYEQCGHDFHLSLHETPRKLTESYHGIKSSSSHPVIESCASDMATHFVLKRGRCEGCCPSHTSSASSTSSSKSVLWRYGRRWLKKSGIEGGCGAQRGVGTGKGGVAETSPIQVIVARRESWKKVVEEQKERIEEKRRMKVEGSPIQ